MMFYSQHVFLPADLHFHLLTLCSPVPSFFIYCLLPVFHYGSMICHEVLLVVIQFTFETDFLSYLHDLFSQVRIFMLLCFINHGFQVDVVLIVALKV